MRIIKNDKSYSIVFNDFISIYDLEISYSAYKKNGGNLSKEEYIKDQFLKQIKS